MKINRRKFTQSLAGVPLSLTTVTGNSFSNRPAGIHHTMLHHTAIIIPGIRQKVKILQISDSHISILNDSEKEYEQYGQRMHNAFRSVKHFETGETGFPSERFQNLIRYGIREQVDLLALSGDILNYPSKTSVAFVKEQLDQAGLPHMYTAGNHDWHYEGMEGSADELRDYWCKNSLLPLYSGGIYASSGMIGDVNVVMIDNSTYQVNEEQLAFFRNELKKGYPVALIVHIPLYIPGMNMCCGHPDWGWEADRGYEIERRQRWSKSGNLQTTTAFVKEVSESTLIAGVFAGHWHRFHTSSWKGPTQHLALPAFNGQSRMISFSPE